MRRTVRGQWDHKWQRRLWVPDLRAGPLGKRACALGAGVGRERTWDAARDEDERTSPRQGRSRGGGRAARPPRTSWDSAPAAPAREQSRGESRDCALVKLSSKEGALFEGSDRVQ